MTNEEIAGLSEIARKLRCSLDTMKRNMEFVRRLREGKVETTEATITTYDGTPTWLVLEGDGGIFLHWRAMIRAGTEPEFDKVVGRTLKELLIAKGIVEPELG